MGNEVSNCKYRKLAPGEHMNIVSNSGNDADWIPLGQLFKLLPCEYTGASSLYSKKVRKHYTEMGIPTKLIPNTSDQPDYANYLAYKPLVLMACKNIKRLVHKRADAPVPAAEVQTKAKIKLNKVPAVKEEQVELKLVIDAPAVEPKATVQPNPEQLGLGHQMQLIKDIFASEFEKQLAPIKTQIQQIQGYRANQQLQELRTREQPAGV